MCLYHVPVGEWLDEEASLAAHVQQTMDYEEHNLSTQQVARVPMMWHCAQCR